MKILVNLIILLFLFFIFKSEKPIHNAFSTQQDEVQFNKIENIVLASGRLLRADSFPSSYIKPRPVDVWLPENYSSDKKYNVLYMHDGQMLFDSTKTWNKQEWKVDEWITTLSSSNTIDDIIVVGIHNIPNIRWLDLFPEKAMDYMKKSTKDSLYTIAEKSDFKVNLQGDEYLKFIVDELKPVIEKQFSVATGKENTFVAGSSMGGLMSMYAISEYPEVFSGAACLSTHWVGAMPAPNNPYPEAIFSYMEQNLPNPKDHKLYFDYGNKTLDQHYPKFADRVNKILQIKGYTAANSKNLFFEGTDHSENSWNKRLDIPLTFLLAN